MTKCYTDCEIKKTYTKLDFHFDWLDCPYYCEYGDTMLTAFKESGCKTLAEFEQLRGDNNEA